jgi:hypothetical protein
LSELVLNCIERNIPIPAYESFFNKKTLPRRYFIFFDLLYQAGRHNKQLWKVVTELNHGDNQVPYGSCIFEAHVMTTLQENYYKWLFLLLSDVDEVKEEHYEGQFRMEYECGDKETGEMYEELVDYQETNTRLRHDVEIYFDENESDKRQLFKVETGTEEMESLREREREVLEALIRGVKIQHQQMIEKMREKVRYIRDIKRSNRMTDEEIKKMVSMEKRRLIQFRKEGSAGDDECSPPEQKRRKSMNDHKSRCSDLKVQFFQKTKEMLDEEEADGLIASWERVYKYIMNKHVKEKINEVEPVMKEPSKMLNIGDLEKPLFLGAVIFP